MVIDYYTENNVLPNVREASRVTIVLKRIGYLDYIKEDIA
jgi:hypothetical protein